MFALLGHCRRHGGWKERAGDRVGQGRWQGRAGGRAGRGHGRDGAGQDGQQSRAGGRRVGAGQNKSVAEWGANLGKR